MSWSGDIVHLRVLGKSIIVLSTLETINDLLEKRSAIYSCRPRSTMMHELCVSSRAIRHATFLWFEAANSSPRAGWTWRGLSQSWSMENSGVGFAGPCTSILTQMRRIGTTMFSQIARIRSSGACSERPRIYSCTPDSKRPSECAAPLAM